MAHSKAFKSKTVQFRGYYSIILFLLLIMADRMSKIWAAGLTKEINLGILSFTYVTNTGAGFSIMQNMNTLLAVLSIMLLATIIFYRKSVPEFSCLLIISGIVGNVIDRIFYGSVIDFINLRFWPIFNVADSLIFIGVGYWIIVMIKEWKEENKRNKKY